MATDFDSAGVYFLSVEEFEGRPRHDNPDKSAGKKNRTTESGGGSNAAGEQLSERDVVPALPGE